MRHATTACFLFLKKEVNWLVLQYFANHLGRVIPGAGPYDIPVIAPEEYTPCVWQSFKHVGFSNKRRQTGIHFFLPDCEFERIWTTTGKYIEALKQFAGVMSPDFSLFTDWPVAAQIWNHYRKHYLAALLQEAGAKVYPTISWSDKRSYAWCFDGEPVGATVCVSSVGTQYYETTQRLFLSGYDAMLERLQPKTILFYGNVPPECRGNIIPIGYDQLKFREQTDV